MGRVSKIVKTESGTVSEARYCSLCGSHLKYGGSIKLAQTRERTLGI